MCETLIFHSPFPHPVETPRHFTFYAVEFTHFGKKFSAEVLILRGKMLFSVEKYVGNVDNF